jgi:hypothetical protein
MMNVLMHYIIYLRINLISGADQLASHVNWLTAFVVKAPQRVHSFSSRSKENKLKNVLQLCLFLYALNAVAENVK